MRIAHDFGCRHRREVCLSPQMSLAGPARTSATQAARADAARPMARRASEKNLMMRKCLFGRNFQKLRTAQDYWKAVKSPEPLFPEGSAHKTIYHMPRHSLESFCLSSLPVENCSFSTGCESEALYCILRSWRLIIRGVSSLQSAGRVGPTADYQTAARNSFLLPRTSPCPSVWCKAGRMLDQMVNKIYRIYLVPSIGCS